MANLTGAVPLPRHWSNFRAPTGCVHHQGILRSWCWRRYLLRVLVVCVVESVRMVTDLFDFFWFGTEFGIMFLLGKRCYGGIIWYGNFPYRNPSQEPIRGIWEHEYSLAWAFAWFGCDEGLERWVGFDLSHGIGGVEGCGDEKDRYDFPSRCKPSTAVSDYGDTWDRIIMWLA